MAEHTDKEWEEIIKLNLNLKKNNTYLSDELNSKLNIVHILENEISNLTNLNAVIILLSFFIGFFMCYVVMRSLIDDVHFSAILATYWVSWFFSVMSYWGILVFTYKFWKKKNKSMI